MYFKTFLQVLESQGDNLLAGSFAMEAGQRLMKRGVVSQAISFFQRAIELQHQTKECKLDTLKELTKSYVYLSELVIVRAKLLKYITV